MTFLEPDFSGLSSDQEAIIDWLARLRTIAALGQTIMVPIGIHRGLISYNDIFPLFLAVTLLLSFNVFVWNQMRKARKASSYTICIHLCLDFAFFAVFLTLSSGVVNPLINICFLHYAIAGLSMNARLCVGYFIWGSLLLTVTFYKTVPNFWSANPLVHLATYVFVGLTIMIVTQWFSQTMQRHKNSINQLRQQLGKVDSLRATGLIAANMCHEISTPLNEAVLRLENIKFLKHEKEIDSHTLEVQNILLHCGQKLQGMFSSASMEEKQKFITQDIALLAKRAAKTWHSELCPSLELDVIVPEKPILKFVPTILFIRTFIDFLDNARDATENLGNKVLVRVEQVGSDLVSVSVEDNGPGFPPGIQEKLGTPFLTNKPDGVGLGLYTASHLALHIGGSLSLDKSPLGGAKVSLVF